ADSGGEARAATASGGGVRVADDELRAFEVVLVVDFSAHQVLQAHGIDQQGDAVLVHASVVVVGDLIEGETVLKAGAATPLHKDAQFQVGIAFFQHQIGHLGGSAVGKDDGRG